MWPDKDTRAPDMGAHSRVPTPAEMADRFADADADGSGTIDMDELQTILPVEYSRAQLETTFRKYDADGMWLFTNLRIVLTLATCGPTEV